MRLTRSGFVLAMATAGVAVNTDISEAQRGRAPAQAAAQAPGAARPIRFATPVSDTLREADQKMSGRGAFRVYRFEARADKRYTITLQAPDFDAYVWVARPVGVLTEELASDDDGGEGTDARLRFKPPAAGSYYLVAQSLAADGSGGYTIQIVETDPPPAPASRMIAVGQSMQGELTDESPVREEDGDQPYDLYTVRGKGQRVRIAMNAENFDAYLQVVRVTESGEEEVASDDDSGGGTNARVTLALDGEYRIIARALSSDGRGAYEISVTEPPPVVIMARSIAVGEAANGELTETDPELEDGGYFHEYTVTASAGDAFRITMTSSDFDSYLRWGTKNGEMFTEISSDDDSGGELNSMLSVRVERSGTYVIRVSALGSGSKGSYALRFERAP